VKLILFACHMEMHSSFIVYIKSWTVMLYIIETTHTGIRIGLSAKIQKLSN